MPDLGPGFLTDDKLWFQAGVTVLVIALYIVARRMATIWSARYKETTRRYQARKFADGIAAFAAFAFLLYAWFPKEEHFWQVLALVSAGLVVALSGPITNVAGWAYIVLRQPFSLKDRIQVGGDLAGDVIDISLFTFSLIEIGNWVDADMSTGRIVHVPNGVVFQKHISNYTQGFGFIWNEIAITVTFESNWEKAHQLFTDLIEEFSTDVQEEARAQMREASSRYMVYYTRLTPIVWLKVCDIGVTLTMRYLCEARRRRGSETMLWMEILRAVENEPDIDFAYPTERRFNNVEEGKPGTGGPSLDTAEMVGAAPPSVDSEMTVSIGNLQDVYERTRAEVVLPGEGATQDVHLEEEGPEPR